MRGIWLFLFVVPFLIGILIVNLFFSTENIPLEQQAQNAIMAGNYIKAERVYEELIEIAPLNIDFHRSRIRSHFNRPKKIGKGAYRDDETIALQYATFASTNHAETSDIGYYGIGHMEVIKGNDDKALFRYLKVKNTKLHYLNNSIGYIYLTKKYYVIAERYFLKEIEAQGNLSGAYSNLAKVYEASGQEDKLIKLLSNTEAKQYISERVIRHHLLKNGNIKDYSAYAFSLGNVTTTGLVGALLILAFWIVFILWVDVYETEKLKHILFALCLGSGFSMLATPLYDFYFVTLGWELNGSYLNDLLYSIFAIGVIEETIKIIPFLILLRFTNIINESMDYIVYASVCALGFAFMENLMYFHQAGLDDVLSRSVSATILHMALTSFVAYGLMYGKYKGDINYSAGYFVFAFIAACFIHGFYDFWLLSDGWVGELKFLSLGILYIAVQRYGRAITNALNYSEFNTKKGQLIRNSEFLALSLSIIAVYQYAAIGYKFGAENANINLFMMILNSAFLVFILIEVLGELNVTKGYWMSILKIKSYEKVGRM